MLIVPVLVLLWCLILRALGGPFWLGINYDPSYAYLLSSLLTALGDSPTHADHPGAPLQQLGGLIITAVGVFQTDDEMVMSVLRHSERYLQLLHAGGSVALALLLLAAGLAARRATGSTLVAVMCQVAPLTLGLFHRDLHLFQPELVLPGLGAAVACVMLLFTRPAASASAARGQAAALGALLALNVTLKLTTLPVLIFGVLAPRSWREQAWVWGSFAAAWCLLMLTPVSPSRVHRKAFYQQLVRQQGYNAPPDAADGWQGLAARLDVFLPRLASEFLGVTVCLGLAVCLLAWAVWRFGPRHWDSVKAPLALSVAMGSGLVLVMLGPRAGVAHYLVPAASLVAALPAVAFLMFRDHVQTLRLVAPLAAGLLFAVALVTAGLEGRHIAREAAAWSESADWREQAPRRLPYVTGYSVRDRPSDRFAALGHGNRYANRRFTEALARLEGNVWLIGRGAELVHHYDQSTTVSELLAEHPALMLQTRLPGLDRQDAVKYWEAQTGLDLEARAVRRSARERLVLVYRADQPPPVGPVLDESPDRLP